MKTASLLFMLSISAAPQTPGNVITCDLADAEQCKATVIEARPVRELVHEGTSVAVGRPVVADEREYRVFVRISQMGPGNAVVRPKHISGLYSDPAHTRFAFYDKAAEIDQRNREANRAQMTDTSDDLDTPRRGSGSSQSISGTSKAAKLGLRKTDPNGVAGRPIGSGRAAPDAGTIVAPEELYLSQSTLRRGDFAEGFVYLKRPRHSKIHVESADPLYEIDIPVNGVVFRFN